MRTVIIAALAAATVFVAAPEADAGRKASSRGDNAVSFSRERLKADWARSRAVGGFGNPFSFLFGSDEEELVEQTPSSGVATKQSTKAVSAPAAGATGPTPPRARPLWRPAPDK